MVIPDESKQLLLRADIFNLLKRANDYNPISALNLDGVTLNPEFGKVRSAHDLRQIRLAIQFVW